MRKKYLSALLFGALLFASAGTFTSCKDYDDDINNLQSQITANADAIKALQDLVNNGDYVTKVAKNADGNLVFTFSKSGDQIIELDAEQVGDVLSINTETGELMKNGEPTGWFATKNIEDKNCIKIGEDGCWQLLQDDGTYKSTNIPVSGVTAAQNTETKQWTLTIVDAQGNSQQVVVPSAASVMSDLELIGWVNVSDASADLSQNNIKKDGELTVNYAYVGSITYEGKETTWSAQKEVKKGQVLTTLAANNTKLVTRVSPADLDLSQMSFTLQDSKGNKLPVSLGKAESFTGTLTRTASGISFIPMDVTSDTYTSNQISNIFPAQTSAVYSLVEASGARSTYANFDFAFTPATVSPQSVNKVDGKGKASSGTSSYFEVDLNKANKLEFTGNGLVYDYYVEAADKAVADLFGVTIDKSNGTFTVTKLADEVSRATFDLNVYALHLDGTIYKSTITIKPSAKMAGIATIAAGNQIIKQVVDNNGKLDATYADDMAFTVSLDEMFAALSEADQAKWASSTLGAESYEISSVKIGNEAQDKSLFELEGLKANGTSADHWYEAKKVKVVAQYTDGGKATLSVGKEYTITVNFKHGNDVINTAKITFTPTLPELSAYMVKHPSFWDGNKLMGIAQASNIDASATSEVLAYNIVDAFKTLGSTEDADKLAVTFGLADNKVDDEAFVSLANTNTIVSYTSGTSASKQYGKEFTVNVMSAKYLGVYEYSEDVTKAQSFKMVVLDPVYEGEIKTVEGTALEVYATAGAKLDMADLIGYNYNKQTYNLYKDVKGGKPISANNKGEADDFAYAPIVNVEVTSGDEKVFTVVNTKPTPATWDEVNKKVVSGAVEISTKEISNDTQTTIKVKVTDVWGYTKEVEIPLTIKMAK